MQLLTSTASHGHPGQGEEGTVLDRMVKGMAKTGRERDEAQLTSIHTKLVSCSKDILRNRTSILALLHSLSEKKAITAVQPSPLTSSLPHNNSYNQTSNKSSSSGLGSNFRAPLSSHPSLSNHTLSHSTSQPSLSGSIHPPLPPKPRSRRSQTIRPSTLLTGSGQGAGLCLPGDRGFTY